MRKPLCGEALGEIPEFEKLRIHLPGFSYRWFVGLFGFGCRCSFGVRCSVLDFVWTLDFGLWTLDFGFWILV